MTLFQFYRVRIALPRRVSSVLPVIGDITNANLDFDVALHIWQWKTKMAPKGP